MIDPSWRSEATRPLLAVIIACTRPERVAPCLAALDAQADVGVLEVFVVGDVAGLADRWRFPLRALPCPDRHANVRRNLAIAEARAGVVAFLDDDVIPQPGWLRAALSVDPRENRILTGPEEPVLRGPHSALIYAVCRSWFAEGAGGHLEGRQRAIPWRKAPFCNYVLPRRLFDVAGLPATDIPWDMDDLEFNSRVRHLAVFENEPALAVWHDRYPESVLEFLRYKWQRRVRTGEKVVARPDLYRHQTPVLACALLPWILAAAAALFRLPPDDALGLALTAWGAVLGSHVPAARREGGWGTVVAYLALLTAVGAITVAGVQVGVGRGVLARLKSWLPVRRARS